MSSGLVLLLVAAGVIYGGDFFGIRDRLQPLPSQPAPLAHGVGAGGQSILASTPYWQTVASLQGGAAFSTRTVIVSDGALQWRASWTCAQSGRLLVRDGASGSKALIDAGCPGRGTAFASVTGPVRLDIMASGPWQMTIEQQVDVPINQPPLAATTAAGATVASAGTFYGVDQQGRGTVTVYRLADNGYAVRLDNFYVTPNAALDIRFSTPAAPHNDTDVSSAPVAHIADLVATAGSMNFSVPPGVQPAHFGSITVWCVQLQTAYAAATLVTPR
ncbi:MAG: DM13 domain-containing protein [Candidatus Dormibacteraeota bacterium]|nr:DM13 domain-containing protein [Candidatus Dormibacteraeota bacterium]